MTNNYASHSSTDARTVRRLGFTFLFALASTLAGLAPGDAATGKRHALLIANSTYIHTKPLRNPVNDTKSIAARLSDLGFDVRIEQDLDARGLAKVIQEFSAGLDKETDGLFYYAGHGLQFRGENFLIGVDAVLKSEAALQFETFRLNSVVNLMEHRAGTLLLFWDACRNNPLSDELMRSVAPSVSRDPSLAPRSGAARLPSRGGDTLVVFSAEPGKEALDGLGDLSPFAESLSNHISTPNIEVESMLKRVTADVLEATHQFQRPERLSQLTRDFFFRGEEPAVAAYEAELQELRAKLARIERAQSVTPRRFSIVNVKDAVLLRAEVKVATRGPEQKDGSENADTRPAKAKSFETGSVDDEGATTAGELGNVVVEVNTDASTVVRRFRISPSGEYLAVGGDDGLVRILSMESFELIRTIRAHSARVSDLDFSPDNRTLVSAGRDGAIRFWDVKTGSPARKELNVPGVIPYTIKLNPEFPDRYVLMGDRSGKLIAWDLKRDRIITNAVFHEGPTLSVGYQPGGHGTFFSGGGDGMLKVRLPLGQRYGVKAHEGAVFFSGYSADGSRLYSAGADRKIKIWDAAKLQGGTPNLVLNGHLRYVLAADMSSDGKLLVSGGGDKALNLWDLHTGELMAHLTGHSGDIEAVAFTPNGKFVVSASEDKSVRIWSVETHEELVRLFFQGNGDKYVGVTTYSQSFGDENSDLIAVYVDGRKIAKSGIGNFVQYIGRGIALIDTNKQ